MCWRSVSICRPAKKGNGFWSAICAVRSTTIAATATRRRSGFSSAAWRGRSFWIWTAICTIRAIGSAARASLASYPATACSTFPRISVSANRGRNCWGLRRWQRTRRRAGKALPDEQRLERGPAYAPAAVPDRITSGRGLAHLPPRRCAARDDAQLRAAAGRTGSGKRDSAAG